MFRLQNYRFRLCGDVPFLSILSFPRDSLLVWHSPEPMTYRVGVLIESLVKICSNFGQNLSMC